MLVVIRPDRDRKKTHTWNYANHGSTLGLDLRLLLGRHTGFKLEENCQGDNKKRQSVSQPFWMLSCGLVVMNCFSLFVNSLTHQYDKSPLLKVARQVFV